MKKYIILFVVLILVSNAYSNSLKQPIGIDDKAIAGLGRFLSSQYKYRALTENEIKIEIGTVFEKNEKELYGLLRLPKSIKDEAALRLLIDVVYYQDKYAHVLNAELAEGLNESFEKFFEGSAEVVENVLKDKNQIYRESIVYHYFSYLSMIGLDEYTRNEYKKELPPHLYKINMIIDKYVEIKRIDKNKRHKSRGYEIVFK